MNFLVALCIGGFAASVSARTVDPMLPVIAADFDITLGQAAILASAYSFPYAVMQLVLGPIGDKIGKSRIIRISLGVITLASILCALGPSYDLVLFGRIMAGAFAGGVFPAGLAIVGDRVARDQRQLYLSRMLVASILGQVAGAASAGILAAYISWRAMFGLTTAVAALAWVVSLLFLDSRNEMRSHISLLRAFGNYRVVLSDPKALPVFLLVGLEGILLFGVFPFVAPMLMGRGASGSVEAGIALGAFACGGGLYGISVRRLAAKLGQWGLIRAGGIVAGAAYVAVALPLPWIATPFLFLVAGFGFYMLHNTLQNQATEIAPSARGATFAAFASSFFLGQSIGPAIDGVVARDLGYAPLFVGCGLLIAIAAPVLAALIKRRSRAPQE